MMNQSKCEPGTNDTAQERGAAQPGLRVRTELRAGGNSSGSSCKICRRNCTVNPDYYNCLWQCELVCSD